MNTSRRKRNHAAWVGPLVALTGLVTYFTIAVRFPDLRDSAIVNLVLVTILPIRTAGPAVTSF